MQVVTNYNYLEKKVIDVLKYFHVFKHPLLLEDIHHYVPAKSCVHELRKTLEVMVNKQVIYKHDDMYMLEDDKKLVEKRNNGAAKAASIMPEAMKSAKLISQFPFVSGICISGSLSKGYADDHSDIDFFIITKPHRLWICRTLLHVFKKFTFLINKQHSFCMNYFIDESKLELEEQNRFTATELATLIPIYNSAVADKLFAGNKHWITEQLPNVAWRKEHTEVPGGDTWFKSLQEGIFNILWPKKLNLFLMKLTDWKWRKKWAKRNYPMEDYDLAMKTKWYVSKHHPTNYQKKVLNASSC